MSVGGDRLRGSVGGDRLRGSAIETARWRVAAAGAALVGLPVEARAAAIAAACARVRAEVQRGALGDALAASSGLSVEGVRWGIESTLSILEPEALAALAAGVTRGPQAPVTVVLAGNVLTACARPLLLPLLAGVPVLAKASSKDDALARALSSALREVDARVGDACEVLSFAHGDAALDDALVRAALRDHGCVNVYGSDETVAAIEAAARAIDPGARVIGHGHGLGLCYVARDAVSEATAAAVALDVCAYDQRGCLSPHAVYVEGSSGAPFAELLHAALGEREAEMPRGAVPQEAAAQQLQWRGVAAAIGQLHASATHAVSYEGDGALRASPGYRNVAILDCPRGTAELTERAHALGGHLKALGIAGSADTMGELAGLAPYVCPVSKMQSPGLTVELDGLPVMPSVGVG